MANWFGLFGSSGSSDDAQGEAINDNSFENTEVDTQMESLVNEATNDEINGLASLLGFSDKDLSIPEIKQELGKTIKQGGMVGSSKDDKFIDFWDKAGFTATTSRNNQSRIARYKRYQFMVSQCLSGDTEILLSDGTSVAIQDLVGRKKFYVYAYDTKTKKVVVSDACNARVTKKTKETLLVTLDDGSVIKCTPEHPFLQRDGEYVEAQHLQAGSSIMPLNQLDNHKVVSVETVQHQQNQDMYDIEVPTYHNFALASGVFVHNSTEINMAVRTYIDEAVSAIQEENDFFKIEVRDKDGKRIDNLSKFVNRAAQVLGIGNDDRKTIGNLSVNGDHFFRIESIRKAKAKDNPAQIVDGWVFDGYHINEPIRVDRFNLPHKDVPLRFMQYGSYQRQKGQSVFPWDMIHFRLDSIRTDIYPYGESLIESVRSVYKRLLILESLLALTRASKVEHMIIKVPTNNDNPDVQVTKLMRFAPLIKNILLGGGMSMSQEKKNIAFSDILFIPKGKDAQSSFEMDRMASSVDLSTIEDVEYFQDKVTNGLNLPRGWLKSDDAYMGYRKLAAQDLRLARTINNILRSMATAYTLAGKIILHRTGKWDPTYKVVTTYTPPAPIASEQLAGLRDALDIITQMIDLSGNPDPETGEVKKEPDLVRKLLIKVAKLPATTVDDMLPPGKKTEELTNEQIKQIAIQAFCSSGDEEVTSDKTPLIWYNNENVRNPYQSDRKITTEMIV